MTSRLFHLGAVRAALPTRLPLLWRDDRSAQGLLGENVVDELVVLATCERAEVYGLVADRVGDATALVANARGAWPAITRAGTGHATVTHLVRVASGLESRIPGECHVLGQVSRAASRARARGVCGPTLDRLFNAAVRCGRRVRAQTGLDRIGASYVTLAIERVRAVERAPTVLVIGSGALARDLVAALDGLAAEVIVASRHPDRARARIRGVARVVALDELRPSVAASSVVIAASTSTRPLVRGEHIAGRQKGLLLVDLGMPPNIAEDAAASPWVERIGLDDLAPERGPAQRTLRHAERLAAEAADELLDAGIHASGSAVRRAS